ncbi:MAG: phospho-sugar mutase [Oscillospiraceae bacterium]|nr:phospho-sugar mutase [Oscillospiraceae bacterium]
MEKIPADDYFRPQLEALAHNPDERTDAFGGDLLFGTGGLRAKIAPGTNRMNNLVAGRAAQGFANYLTKKYPGIERRVCVAYDTRECSKAFAGTVASVFAASGFRVFLYAEPRPTPMLSFAVRHFEAHAGVMITASHNPKQYNGFKAYNQTGGQLTDAASAEVEHEINRLDVFGVRRHLESQAADPANIIMLGKDFDDVYCEAVTKYLPRTDYAARHGDCLRLIYTPLFGTGATPVQALLERLGYNVHLVEEQSAPNGAFPGLRKPNPEEKEVFALAIEKAKTIRPDIIFATDPDADRIGVLAQNGDAYEVLSGSQTGALLAAYLIEAKAHSMQNPAIVTTIVTGTLAQRICEANGTAVALVLTGFKYIGERMDAWKADGSHTFLFGFEESFGYLVGDASRDKDAVITSALVAEMALWYKREKNQTLYEALQSLYQTYGPVSETLLELEAPEPNGQLLVEKIMRHARTNYAAFLPDETVVALEDYQSSVRHDLQSGTSEPLTLPVSNVIKLFFADGAWLVLRPSGTEPKIKLYICTNNAFGTGATLADAKTRCAILKVKLEITLNALLK